MVCFDDDLPNNAGVHRSSLTSPSRADCVAACLMLADTDCTAISWKRGGGNGQAECDLYTGFDASRAVWGKAEGSAGRDFCYSRPAGAALADHSGQGGQGGGGGGGDNDRDDDDDDDDDAGDGGDGGPLPNAVHNDTGDYGFDDNAAEDEKANSKKKDEGS